MGVGTLEEMIDDNHAIVSSSVGDLMCLFLARVDDTDISGTSQGLSIM